jgi:hypothetical protein
MSFCRAKRRISAVRKGVIPSAARNLALLQADRGRKIRPRFLAALGMTGLGEVSIELSAGLR